MTRPEPPIDRQRNWMHAVLGLAAAVVILTGGWLIDRSESRKHDAVTREQVQNGVSAVRAGLEMAINERIHLARGLGALALINPEIGHAEFEIFARALQDNEEGIRSLQLARDAVVSHVYPLAGNEAAVGHRLLVDPAVADGALQALRSRHMMVAGPYTLRQGGEAFVARLPVYLEKDFRPGHFWGFATVVMDARYIFEHGGVHAYPDLQFAIRGRDAKGAAGAVFYGDAAVFGMQPVLADVTIPNGRWQIAGLPVHGWGQSWPGRQWLVSAVVMLLLTIPLVLGALRRAGSALMESERLGLRDRILNSIGEGVYGLDAQGRCTFVNPAALRLLGFTREELIGADPHLLFDGPEPQPCEASPGGRQAEHRYRRKDGTTFPAQVTSAPLAEGEGCVVAFSDITERHVANERLRLAASVFANTQQGIMITDSKGDLVDVNPAFTEITGYAREEVIGRNPRLLSSGRQGAEFYSHIKQSLATTRFWRGEIWNRHKNGTAYPELLSIAAVDDGIGGVSHYIGVFSDISRQKQHEAELARIAHYDALTGLPNRVLLTDRLAQSVDHARRARARVAVCMLDLDRFKDVNVRYGSDTGDAVLVEVAHRLRGASRSGDTVARLGGDEFVLLLNVDGVASSEQHAHRILKAIAAPVYIDGREIEISASIGITLFPDDASDAETLLRHADQVMYAAKQEGRNRYRLFDPEKDRHARKHRETLERIGRALDEQEFRLHFQPKVDMRAGRIVGFEALVRWQHPAEGLMGPGEFLPVIEATDLDVELGRWVLAQGLRHLSEWRALGLRFGIGVNISATHLLTPGFVEELGSLLKAHPLIDPRLLEIEILETAAIADMDAASVVLRRCRELGVSVALDDFGTGYSSLAYFRQLPVDTLKIDKIFIRDMLTNPDDMAIVEGIVRFARAFNRQIVAEGVEFAELCPALVKLGCDIAQGHALSAPMPAERVPEWSRSFRPDPAWTDAPAPCAGVPAAAAEPARAER